MKDTKTIVEILEENAIKNQNKIFIELPDYNYSASYSKVNSEVKKVASFMMKKGMKKGDKIAIISKNRPEYIIVYYAILKIGGIVVPINFNLPTTEIKNILDFADISLIWIEKDFLDLSLKYKSMFMEEVSEIEENNREFEEINLDEEALISFTSGSTGKPKGVILTHRNIISDCLAIKNWINISSEDKFLGVQQLFYIDHMVFLNTPLLAGASTLIVQKFSRSKFWKTVRDHHITMTNLVPTMMNILNSNEEKIDKSDLKFVLYGGEASLLESVKQFEEKYGVPTYEGYGLTESTCVSTFNPIDKEKRKIGSIGKEIISNTQSILDSEYNILNTNIEGEIAIKGETIMKGYYKNKELTEETIKNGWLLTGDLGYKDEDGFFYLTGRKKEVIIRGAEKISSDKIDKIILNLPEIKESKTIGIRDETYGEEIVSFVILKKDISIGNILNHCKRSLTPNLCPKKVIVIKEFPKIKGIDKIDKNKLKEYLT